MSGVFDGWMTLPEAARKTGVTSQTMRQRAKTGMLHCERLDSGLLLVHRDELARWETGHKRAPALPVSPAQAAVLAVVLKFDGDQRRIWPAIGGLTQLIRTVSALERKGLIIRTKYGDLLLTEAGREVAKRLNGNLTADLDAPADGGGPVPRLEGDNIVKSWRYKGP